MRADISRQYSLGSMTDGHISSDEFTQEESELKSKCKCDLEGFILLYESCRLLWDPKHPGYTDPVSRNEELDKLLKIYKNIKPNATIADVKSKINSLRSNFRKELKKVEKSIRMGNGRVYKPASKTFHHLKFLTNILKSKSFAKPEKEEASEFRSEEQNPLYIPSPPTNSNNNKPIEKQKTEHVIKFSPRPSVSRQSQQDVNAIALVWSDKLNSLKPNQRLFAEKAINDVLFEAQLNNLSRDSVQINIFQQSSPVHTPLSPEMCVINYESD